MIRVENLRKRAGDREILKGISFEVAPRTVLGVIGGSGVYVAQHHDAVGHLEHVVDRVVADERVTRAIDPVKPSS